jgi:hypothetical protein
VNQEGKALRVHQEYPESKEHLELEEQKGVQDHLEHQACLDLKVEREVLEVMGLKVQQVQQDLQDPLETEEAQAYQDQLGL